MTSSLSASNSFKETNIDESPSSGNDASQMSVAERVAMFKRTSSNSAGIDPGTIQVFLVDHSLLVFLLWNLTLWVYSTLSGLHQLVVCFGDLTVSMY